MHLILMYMAAYNNLLLLFAFDMVVCWVFRYDAVTIEGKLRWQDALTSLNKPFFDACDGNFLLNLVTLIDGSYFTIYSSCRDFY